MDSGTATCIFGSWENAFWFVCPLNLMAMGDGQRKCKMHFGGLEKCILVRGAFYISRPQRIHKEKPKCISEAWKTAFWFVGPFHLMALGGWTKNAKCLLEAWRNAFWFVGPMNFMAMGHGQRKPKMHFGGLENSILICGALSFDGPGGWTKEMQNSFMEPGKCILVCGAP